MIQLICVAKEKGLGLVIRGGANRAEGPMVFIQEIMQGGDCQKVFLYFFLCHKLVFLKNIFFYEKSVQTFVHF